MNPAHLIEHARQSGVVLMLIGDRLTWSAPKPPTPALLTLLRDNKPAVIEHLRHQQRAWLERVAALLDTTANDLLARGLIDANDMAEQYQADPRHAARLIASAPNWLALEQVRGQFCAQYAPARAYTREPDWANQPSTPDSITWTTACNAIHRHALGTCPACYPPRRRYCKAGSELHARYEHETTSLEARNEDRK